MKDTKIPTGFVFDERVIDELADRLLPLLRERIEREHQSRAGSASMAKLSPAARQRKARAAVKARWAAAKAAV